MNKIDFAVILSVENCNPNGDPVNAANMPRQDYDGYGEMSDVCLKRKIRTRMKAMGYNILMAADLDNNLLSVASKVEAAGLTNKLPCDEFIATACNTWIDVRAFGQVFAYKGEEKKGKGVSIGIRGPVTVTMARSIDLVDIVGLQITKTINAVKNTLKKDRTTMGQRYIVRKGAYIFYGSIIPQLAEKTGLSEQDVKTIKYALCTLLEGDESSARPSGSMAVQEVYWWEHNCPSGQYPAARVHRSLHLTAQETYPFFTAEIETIPGLTPEIIRPQEGECL